MIDNSIEHCKSLTNEKSKDGYTLDHFSSNVLVLRQAGTPSLFSMMLYKYRLTPGSTAEEEGNQGVNLFVA